MKKRSYWNTRLGLYLATLGTAFGLGNLWRFPYIVSENGGGAFFFLYIFVAAVIGLPMFIGELILGKHTGKSLVESVALILTQDKGDRSLGWQSRSSVLLGHLPIFLSLIVMAYYAVLSGWVLYFSMQFLVHILGDWHGEAPIMSKFLMENGWLQLALSSVHLLVACALVAKRVQEGLERWVSYLMPVFAVLVVILIGQSLSLSSSEEALRFLFYPDFSKLTLSSLGYAVGHVLFTLSLGFGTMVTFGSYMGERDNVPAVGLRVAVADTVMSVMAGLLIFPILFASKSEVAGPTTFFETIPYFFSQMEWGEVFGFFFFICLYLASLGATIALLENMVANITERRKVKRTTALWWVSGVALILSGMFSLSPFFDHWLGSEISIFVLIDSVFINWFLPISALGILMIVSYKLDDRVKKAFFIDESRLTTINLYKDWHFVLRWICPLVIFIALLLQFYSLFSDF